MMKAIIILGSPIANPAIKSGATCTFGLCLSDAAPSSDVTVTITSRNGWVTGNGPFTFTPGNFAVPQEVVLTAVENGIVEGIKYDVVSIVATGGGYNITKRIRVPVSDAGINPKFLRGFPSYHLNVTDVQATRAALIAEVFNGGGLPANAVPALIEYSYSGTMHQTSTSAVTGEYLTTKLAFNRTDRSGYVWTHIVYHIQATANSNKCCLVNGGHGSESGHLAIIQDLIANGIDVLYCAMPVTFQNTENNPTVNATGVSGHNDIKTGGLDNGVYNPLELFLFDKIEAINYVKMNFNYLDIYMCGCSGGGWTTLMTAAMDSRIRKSIDFRGATPSQFLDNPVEVDYEQGPYMVDLSYTYADGATSPHLTAMYTSINYYDLMILASSDGREFHTMHHYNDTCCHKTFVYNTFMPRLQNDARNLGANVFLFMLTDPAYAEHGFNVPDRAYAMGQFKKI